MPIIHTAGDILESDARVLVNPVNCVGAMGRGLAAQFKRVFPEMFDSYREACRAGLLVPGSLHVWEDRGGRVIVNLPTKRHWRARSRLEDVGAGIDALAELARERALESIAVPALGCGLGGLDVERVRELVEGAFSTSTCRVMFYSHV